MKSITEKTLTAKFQTEMNLMMLGLLAALSLLSNVGCSTPRVDDYSSGPDDIAWSAYSDCLKAVGPHGDQRVCDNYDSMHQIALGYNQYVMGELNGTNQTQGSTSYGSGSFRGAETKAEYDSAYRNYLSTLDSETLEDMTTHWQSVAEQYSQAE